MKVKSERQFWSGVMFTVVGAAFTWAATDYSMGSPTRPGPGYFPLILGVLLTALGLWTTISGLVTKSDDGDKIGRTVWRPLLVIVSSITVFGFLLPRLGMAIAAPLLVVMSSFAGTEFRWREVLASAVVLTVFCWLVFVVGLKLIIPMWPTALTVPGI